MARSKRKFHPHVGKYVVRFEHTELDTADERPEAFETPEEAVKDYAERSGPESGEVIYIYQVVAVKVVRQPVLAEDYNP